MTYLLALIAAMATSMALIPLLVRLAPRIGMMDKPDSRKVHAVPIPRAGGIGIVLGALLPVLIWLPADELKSVYLFGALVLLVFGVWDDIRELGHYTKFIGQLLAVLPVVYYGDLFVTHLPFMNDAVPEHIGKPFTVFALMGMINAINHSDGLDGLAGGMSLLSLGCIAYLAFLSNGDPVVLIALATIGGVFGFLRYNTHPARVFMGDGGSQFLGFTLGFLMVYLIEKVDSALSPALPALILGLPIVDILAVFAQRIYHGMNWFRASRNHIHHRLLHMGFDHYEAVVIIYSVQIALVVSAVFLPYESDWLILSIYLGVCATVFGFLIMKERAHWRAHSARRVSRLSAVIGVIKKHELSKTLPVSLVAVGVSLLFVAVSLLAKDVPSDIAMASAVMGLIFLIYLLLRKRHDGLVAQAVSYIAAAFVIYLETQHMGPMTSAADPMEFGYFATLALIIGLMIRYGHRKSEFTTTPMDYLVIFIVLFAGYLLHNLPEKAYLGAMVVKLVIVFYGCELIFLYARGRQYLFNWLVLLSLSAIALKGAIS